jgi:hypothetical protein
MNGEIYTIHGLSLVLHTDRGLLYKVLSGMPQDGIVNKRYKGWTIASYKKYYQKYLARRFNGCQI